MSDRKFIEPKNRPLTQPRPPEPKHRPLKGPPSMRPSGPGVRPANPKG